MTLWRKWDARILRVVLQVDDPSHRKESICPLNISLTYDLRLSTWNMETSGNWIIQISIV